MKVVDIDITGLRYDCAATRHEAHVTLELHPMQSGPNMHVNFLCYSSQLQDCPPALITQDMIADALRQARRMPGFRRGERQLELAGPVAQQAERAASA